MNKFALCWTCLSKQIVLSSDVMQSVEHSALIEYATVNIKGQ